MRRLTGSKSIGSLFKKITASGLAGLLLLAGLTPTTAAAQSCQGWNTAKFFETATVNEVRACLSAGEDPNEQDRQGLTALHRAARDTSDPAVIEALLDAGANLRTYSIAGRLPWDFARRNKKIKGSDAYQRLRVESAKKADWSRVQTVPHNRKTVVRLYQDAASRDNRRIKCRFHSATADSITLVLEDGQTRTFPKRAVRKVLIPRPFSKRTPGWIATGTTAAILIGLVGPWDLGMGMYLLIPVVGAISFLGSEMGPIYDVPTKHRTRPQGDQQSGAVHNTSGKQEESGRPNG